MTVKAREDPGHPLLPDPNGRYLKSPPFIVVMPSAPPFIPSLSSKNLSGINSSGLAHASGSRMMAYTLISVRVWPFIPYPLMVQSSADSLRANGAVGWSLRTSFTTAWR
ncbi:hypothetical protein VIGAN_04284000 [Vigna angularis var. angularis]|uniref:Uncharacterized protein n=1 Tax=Vigna angularis var. angularis TaxID=157739 RepID=A0A0S3RXX7_PHAAN|nr:hypothetical protein VIGAN_04284000 [Vigna angularis var. angularis]